MSMARGLLIIVSGASGTGKGTVCKRLLEEMPEMEYSISATTRTPRAGELDGREYFFFTREQFRQKIDAGEFLEYADVYGNFYGTLKSYVDKKLDAGRDVLLEIDTQGAQKVKAACPEGIFIFLLPPSIEELKQRIIGRGTESKESLIRRLSSAPEEIDIGRQYDYVVVNDAIARAVENIKAIVIAEHSRAERCEDKFAALKTELGDVAI